MLYQSVKDEEEIFKISQDGDKITVTVLQKGSQEKADILYRRTFDQANTRQIHLMGLDGNDSFSVDENVNNRMKLVVEGGKGKDVYSFKGKMKVTVEDEEKDKTTPETALTRKAR